MCEYKLSSELQLSLVEIEEWFESEEPFIEVQEQMRAIEWHGDRALEQYLHKRVQLSV